MIRIHDILVLLALVTGSQPARAMPFDLFGFAVACHDSSSKSDPSLILVSDPLTDTTRPDQAGRVWLLAAQTGKPILHVDGDGSGDRFGSSLAFVDDLDGDGICDFVVSATHTLRIADDGLPRSNVQDGYLRWFSGKDGHALHTLGVPTIREIPPALVSIADVDGDGKRDLLVGLPGVIKDGRACGKVLVLSSKDYSVRYPVFAPQDSEGFGVCVVELGDIDHDGFSDFAVSAVPNYDPHDPGWPTEADRKRSPSGRVFLFSGRGGGLIRELSRPGDRGVFGTALAGGADLNGDKIPDVLVTLSDPSSTSSVFAYSGADGKQIGEWRQSSNVHFGRQLCVVGDFGGDSTSTFVIGERGVRGEGSSARVMSGNSQSSQFVIDHLPKGGAWSPWGGFWAGIALGSVSDCDGVRDIVIGAADIAGLGNPGSVHLFSGKKHDCIWGIARDMTLWTK